MPIFPNYSNKALCTSENKVFLSFRLFEREKKSDYPTLLLQFMPCYSLDLNCIREDTASVYQDIEGTLYYKHGSKNTLFLFRHNSGGGFMAVHVPPLSYVIHV